MKSKSKEVVFGEWQKCPKCDGQGMVSKPPYVAGDINHWTSSAASFTCDVCNGAKVLAKPVVSPTNFHIEENNSVVSNQNVGYKISDIEGLQNMVNSFVRKSKPMEEKDVIYPPQKIANPNTYNAEKFYLDKLD